MRGFPGGAVVESPPANAGDVGSSPGLGRSHLPRSNWAREPQLLSLRVWSLCPATREAAIVRGPRTAMKSGPHLPQLEKALTQKRRPKTAINKFKKEKKEKKNTSLKKKNLVKYNLSKYLIYPVNFPANWKGTIFCGCFLLTWEENSYITMYSYKLFATMMAFQTSYVNIQ